MTVRAIRGATQVAVDHSAVVLEATRELLAAVVSQNALVADDIVFILFTATPDLVSAFPAAAAGGADLADVPRLCAVEMAVDGGLPRTVRLVLFAEGERRRSDVVHVYLGGATVLRPAAAE